MPNKKLTPPVIIIGMHRSGTALVTKMLEKSGVFMGWLCEGNNESIYFLRENEKIFSIASASWDNPSPVDSLLSNRLLSDQVSNSLKKCIESPLSFLYWGPLRWLRMNFGSENLSPWGWKDPRNIFTLPLWLSIYPNAKVIHVVRNGIDVSSSLRRREQKRLKTKKNWRHFSASCLDLENGFSLWERYVAKGLEYEKNLQERCLRICYEEFLSNPESILSNTLHFIGMRSENIGTEQIGNLIEGINPTRKNAFRRDPELIKFYNMVKSTDYMKSLGYAA